MSLVIATDEAQRARDALPSAKGWCSPKVPRGFVLDILLAHGCRELDAVLMSSNSRELTHIARVFTFEFTAANPWLP